MEAQVANDAVVQTPSTESNPKQKTSLLKRTPKWALYALGTLIVAVLLAFGYTQHWFKLGKFGSAEKSVEAVSAVAPAAAPVAAPEAAPAAVAASDEGLVKARQAYASGDVQGAISAYRELLAKNPKDIGAMGELGNVLYATGGSTQAAQTYFDAANLALAQGNQQVAEALLPVIEEGNEMLADQLHDKLFDAQMRADGFNPEQQG
jgi:tetratricopeptide (TPR) repeat protein